MSNLTRIQNNQIFDSTIQAQSKIASGSITGNLFAPSVTLRSNITILGNLTVANSYTQLNSVNTYINDPIVVFNNNYSNTLSGYDIGILINRNLSSLNGFGSVNTFLGWSETDSAFIAAATTDTGAGITSINNSGYANLIVGRLTASSASITNSLSAGSIVNTPIYGAAGSFTYLTATTGFSTANAVISGGSLNGTPIGATTASTGNFTGVGASTLVATNFSSANVQITGGDVNGLTTLAASKGTVANFSSANVLITGGDVNSLTTLAATTGTVANFSSGNLNVNTGYAVKLVVDNLSSGNTRISGGYADNFPIGANTAATGSFTTLKTSANITLGGSIIPDTDVAYNLGSNSKAFKDLYLSGSTIYISTSTVSVDTNGNLLLTTAAGLPTQVSIAGSTAYNTTFGSNVAAPWFVGNVKGTYVNATTMNAGTLSAVTEVATNFSSGNVLVTGGDVNGLTTLAASKGTVANFSSGNALITGGDVNSLTTLAASKGTIANFSSSNVLVTGGDVNSLTTLAASKGTIANFGSANALIINEGVTTIVATNLSSGNAWILGGYADNFPIGANVASTGKFTTVDVTGNLSAGNISTTGTPWTGNISGVNTITANTGYFGNLYVNNIQVSSVSVANVAYWIYDRKATDNNTYYPTFGNVGDATANTAMFNNGSLTYNPGTGVFSATSFAGIGNFTTAYAGNFSSANAQITNGLASTLVATNLSSANAVITGGTIDGTPIGDSTRSSGKFTTGSFNDSTNTSGLGTGALIVSSGGASVQQDLYVGGNIYVGNLISTTSTILEVLDPLLYLSASNPATYNYDIGFYSHFVGGTPNQYQHSGFVRNHVDNVWTLFSNIGQEPANGSVDLANVNIVYDSLRLGKLFVTNAAASTGPGTGALTIAGGASIGGTLYAYGVNASSGNISGALYTGSLSTANAVITGGSASFAYLTATTGFSTANAQITGGTISGAASVAATAGQFTNLSSGNVLITGGDVNSLTTLAASKGTIANFSSANVLVTGGDVNGLTTLAASKGTIGNFSSANVLIAGGDVNGLTTLAATTGTVANFGSGNAVIGTASATTLVATNLSSGNAVIGTASATTLVATNFSSANVKITGGDVNGLTTLAATTGTVANFSSGNVSAGTVGATTLVATNLSSGNVSAGTVGATTLVATNLSSGNVSAGTVGATTLVATNFSSGNAQVSAGNVNGLTTLSATTGTVNNFGSGNAIIGTASATTLVATNFSTANAVIAGGSANGLTTLSAATATFTNLSSGNAVITSEGVTTSVITNLSSGNAVISGGSLNGTTVGASTASTGAFTTLTASGTTIASGNIVAASGTASTNTTTGALVVVGGIGVSGGIYGANDSVIYGAYTTINNQGVFHEQGVGPRAMGLNINTGSGIGFRAAGAAGNQYLYSSDSIQFATGSTLASKTSPTLGTVGVQIAANGAIIAQSSISSTTTGTGAVIVKGGIGISGNTHIGTGLSVNQTQVAGGDFVAEGINDSTLIWAHPDSTYDQVVIGNSATSSTLVRGAKLIVNSTDSIILPTGTNSQRPSSTGGTDVVGMVRYSTTAGGIEYYTGAQWINTSSTFTLIQENQFTGDGSTVDFTLPVKATTASVLVSINGVLQIGGAGYAYTITNGGFTLSFSEAPAATDIIDTRILTTTSQLTVLASPDGLMSVNTVNGSIYLTTGAGGSSTTTTSWLSTGAQVNSVANVTIPTTNPTTIDSFDATAYSSAEYVVTVTKPTGARHISTVLVAATTTNGAGGVTVLGSADTLGGTDAAAVFAVSTSGGVATVTAEPDVAGSVLRIRKQYQAA